MHAHPNTTYVIAEMACSHDGNVDHGKTIIAAAGKAGAAAIQFQVWIAEDTVAVHHPDYEHIKSLELSRDEWRELADHVRHTYPDMDIIGCVYEAKSVDFLEDVGMDAYKIHTSDLANPLLIHQVARTGKRIDLSVGGSTLDEIQEVLNWIGEEGNEAVWLMYGLQNFPTPTDEIHLSYMRKLQGLFELPVGYQDHTDPESQAAFWLPCTAQGMGIRILEKHVTHDRSKKGADHEAALNPDQFATFMEMVRTVDGSFGISVPKPFTEQEFKYRSYAKKSTVVATDMQAGEVVRKTDLLFLRNETMGLPPTESEQLIGRTLRRDLQAHSNITLEDVQ